MAPGLDPCSNQLLASLPAAGRVRLNAVLEPVELSLGQVLYEAGAPPDQVVFPTTAVVSLLQPVGPGVMAEIALVGHEGVAGIALTMGNETTSTRAVVQCAGHGLRLDGRVLRSEWRVVPMLVMMRYAQALLMQMAQTALCLREHSLEQQMCRWLLLSLDRLHGSELVMTQDAIASMLGAVRQETVACGLRLQAAGLIRYTPGRITVLDRAGLLLRSCDCYAAVSREYQRLRPPRAPA